MRKKTIFLALIALFLCLSIFSSHIGILILPNSLYRQQMQSKDSSTSQTNEITIYTYDSLIAWGENSTKAYEAVFGNFEEQTGISVNVQRMGDAYDALTKALTEKEDPVADIIIGIDNSMIFQAKDTNVLESYTPSTLDQIPDELVTDLDPEHYVVPYDYGLIVPIYKKGADFSPYSMDNFYLDNLTDPDLLKRFVTEDPTLSSPGLGFLLSEIAIYEKILGKSWKSWWREVRDTIDIKPSWDDAFSTFASEAANKDIMISYSTDPAYSAYFYDEVDTAVALPQEGGQSNAWLQIEGIGLVKNAPNPDGAKQFIDYFLDNHSQSWIPTNNWMFPANPNANIDPVFEKYAINHSQVNILNSLFSQEELDTLMDSVLEEWETIMAQDVIPGFELGWLTLSLATLVLLLRTKEKFNVK